MPTPDAPWIDTDGYKPPGCWLLPDLDAALTTLQRAHQRAYEEIPAQRPLPVRGHREGGEARPPRAVAPFRRSRCPALREDHQCAARGALGF